jgi:hypothetical protein
LKTRLKTQVDYGTSQLGSFSAAERYIEDYLRNLKGKVKNTFETHYLNENRNFSRPLDS